MVIEACLYNIQIIGEAVAQLPDDVKNNSPHVPWTLIKGMRNRLIHEYFGTEPLLISLTNDASFFFRVIAIGRWLKMSYFIGIY
jgi:uncharacterized protein with HEPN domain